MLKIILTAMTAGAVLAVSYLPAAAHDDGSIDARQERQAKAIERGRVKGKITWREGRQLRRQQRRIHRLETNFRKDGHLDQHEMAVLHARLDDARSNIRVEKRDGQRRWAKLPRFGR